MCPKFLQPYSSIVTVSFLDYLYRLTGTIVENMRLETSQDANKDLLKAVTKPFTELIIQARHCGSCTIHYIHIPVQYMNI